jgi:excisionase family DNA binding protein
MSAIRCPNCGHLLGTLDLPAPLMSGRVSSGEPDKPLLLRVADAARLLSVSRSTMYQLVASGQVPVVRIGRSIRIPRAGLERLGVH